MNNNKLKQPRSLRSIVLIAVGGCLIAFVLLFFYIMQTAMSRVLLQSETAYLQEEMSVVEKTLGSYRSMLRSSANDLAN